jgi:hypothetical protein
LIGTVSDEVGVSRGGAAGAVVVAFAICVASFIFPIATCCSTPRGSAGRNFSASAFSIVAPALSFAAMSACALL